MLHPQLNLSYDSDDAESALANIPQILARWYATNPSVRRLWAIQDTESITVVLSLEPTSDGDDTLPIWFARNVEWRNQLSALSGHDVVCASSPAILLRHVRAIHND